MKRIKPAVFGIIATLVVVACSPDRPAREPLAPYDVSLAKGGGSQQCAGQLASDIAKELKVLFVGAALDDLQNQLAVIKSKCPNAVPELMTILQSVSTYGAPTTNGNTAQGLVNLWSALVLYVKDETKTWPPSVLMGDGAVAGVPDGGAKVLGAGESMTTFDGQAGLELPGTVPAGGPRLFTFQPVAGTHCGNGTSLRITGRCYDVSDYPDGGTYTPPATLTLCLRSAVHGPSGIGHAKSGFGTEVLPVVNKAFSCGHDETALNSWLGKNAGPLGRVLAHAYDYLRPRSLFADDVGESGSIGDFSLVGGILNVIFEDDFGELNSPPDVGDTWSVMATSPGFVRINPTGLGDLPGPIVELSQAQGNCANCPEFHLLGTRANSATSETIGTYEVTWKSVQVKPNVKEAPFVVLNASNNNNEIARLSYVSVSSQNRLIFTVRNGNQLQTVDAGAWVKEVSQSFKITVNITTLNPATSQTVSLAVDGVPVTGAQNIPASRAASLRRIGYLLTGIDAGIIGADDFRIIRLPDVPPSP
jgi:hypothetical protein